MVNQTTGTVEEQKTESFGTRRQIFGWQADPFKNGKHIMADDSHTQPGGVSSKSPAGHDTGRQFIFQGIVDVFNRTRLLAMPLDESLHLPFEDVGHHGNVFHPGAIAEQLSLSPLESERAVAAGFAVLPLVGNPLHKIHFGTFTDVVGVTATRLPVLLGYGVDGSFQLRAHPCRYRKADEALWTVVALRIGKPLHQLVLVRCGISTVVVVLHRRR